MSTPPPSKEAEALIAFLDAQEAGIVRARQILGQPTQQMKKPPSFDPAKIKWVSMPAPDNPKGPYEKASDEENINNADYAALKTYLKDEPHHQGGYMYWLFTDAKAIGRRKKVKS